MRRFGTAVITRPLRYHWSWGTRERMPDARPHLSGRAVILRPWQRPVEKGIDLCIGLEIMEFALKNEFDVAIVVSLDRDLSEVAITIERMRDLIGRPVRIEAAVPVAPGGRKVLPGFDYTHRITRDVFQLIRDDTDYTVKREDWKPPRPPATLAVARRR